MDLSTIVQTVIGLGVTGGSLAVVWNVFKSKSPKTADLVEQVLNQLRGDDDPTSTVPTRLEALQHVDSLLRYLESQNAAAGIEAVQTLAREIISPTKK